MKPAILMYGASDKNRDMFYSTKYSTPYPFILAIVNEVKQIIVPKSEFSEAMKNAFVNKVLSFDDFLTPKDYAALAIKQNSQPSRLDYASEVAYLFLREKNIKQILVPPDFQFKMAQALKWHGIAVKIEDSNPFFKQRLIKNEEELKCIRQSIEAAENALSNVVEIIRTADVHRDVLHHDGIPVTSESLRQFVRLKLYENDFIIPHPIISSGFDTAYPHKEGSGPIRSDQPIVMDIFPKSLKSGYFADLTRTFVKGKPSAEIKKMYLAVLESQELAISMVKEDVKVSDMYNAVLSMLKSHGFNTDADKNFGFVHSLGHGVGLDVHEPPTLSDNDAVLKAGSIITIEPGLYYPTIGGIRIEDMVLVKKTGCEVLTSYPKEFEL